MQDAETLDERLRAVERALTDDDATLPALDDAASLTRRVDRAEDQLDDLAARVDDLDAAVQALRGYVGNVRHVNEDVERRADAALARVERLEAAVDDAPTSDPHTGPATGPDSDTGDWLSDPVDGNDTGPGTGPGDTSQTGHVTEDDGRGLLARLGDWL